MPLVADDLLFPAEGETRALARDLFAQVDGLPIVSPHGHTDPRWYAEDEPFRIRRNCLSSPITTSSVCCSAKGFGWRTSA
jgi:glucuronate isomerase